MSIKSLLSALIAVASVLLTTPAVSAFCFEEAGAMYGISPDLLRAIAAVESDMNATAINRNANGTYDYGVMQINSSWASKLGAERWANLADACYNVKVGAWILSNCISRYGYTWKAVGCYNATQDKKRKKYAAKIWRQLQKFKGYHHANYQINPR